MGTTTEHLRRPVLGGGRSRDDFDLGGAGQNYLTRIERRTGDSALIEATRAAEHVSLALLAEVPHLDQTRRILSQLGLLGVLAAGSTARAAA